MLGAAYEAIGFLEGKSRETLDTDRKLVLALAMEITIIGEAAARILKDATAAHPNIPWVNIIGMRNVIVHAYFKIDLDVLWEVITINLPQLIPQLEAIVKPV